MPDTLEQSGVAKRRIRILVDMLKSKTNDTNSSEWLCGEVLRTYYFYRITGKFIS